MKKSVKEQLRRQSWTWDNGDGNPVRVLTVDAALRIIRRACKEAYCVGRSHGIIAKGGRGIESDMRAALKEIINGPKKARGK